MKRKISNVLIQFKVELKLVDGSKEENRLAIIFNLIGVFCYKFFEEV